MKKIKNVLVTGSNGFIGKNFCEFLKFRDDIEIIKINKNSNESELYSLLLKADFIYHFAGVNRPNNNKEFIIQNVNFTQKIVDFLISNNLNTPIIFTSSIHANSNSDFGSSKKNAEFILNEYSQSQKATVYNYRLKNIFGKWCKPNYNSVVATFCHNIANDLSIKIDNPKYIVEFIYIDDVVQEFNQIIDNNQLEPKFYNNSIDTSYSCSIKELSETLNSFKSFRKNQKIPDFSNSFHKKLYSTFLSYLPNNRFANELKLNTDDRGSLFEIIKSDNSGQIFASTTNPGITRGNHFHHTKTEKFCVIKGEGLINFRKINSAEIISYNVSGDKPQTVDIPPGYTHNIKNVGNTEMITIFWANEIFDPNFPDTYFDKVNDE